MNYQICELEECGDGADPHRDKTAVELGLEAYEWDRNHGAYDGGIAWAPILIVLGIVATLIVGAIWFL